MRPAALGTRTYVRMYGRTCVGVLTFQLRASLAQPQRVRRSPEISPIMYVRTCLKRGELSCMQGKKQTHTRTHTHKRVFVAGRNESSAVAWLIASKTSDARMAELVHKSSPGCRRRGTRRPPYARPMYVVPDPLSQKRLPWAALTRQRGSRFHARAPRHRRPPTPP